MEGRGQVFLSSVSLVLDDLPPVPEPHKGLLLVWSDALCLVFTPRVPKTSVGNLKPECSRIREAEGGRSWVGWG